MTVHYFYICIKLPQLSHPLPLFHDYLKTGYYPFAVKDDFDLRLPQVINQTLETDIPIYAGMNVSTGRKLKQLLAIVAENQLRVNHPVSSSSFTDFKIDSMAFEIGGKNKGSKQIANAQNGFVVKDDIEKGFLNVVPLWHFGLMY